MPFLMSFLSPASARGRNIARWEASCSRAGRRASQAGRQLALCPSTNCAAWMSSSLWWDWAEWHLINHDNGDCVIGWPVPGPWSTSGLFFGTHCTISTVIEDNFFWSSQLWYILVKILHHFKVICCWCNKGHSQCWETFVFVTKCSDHPWTSYSLETRKGQVPVPVSWFLTSTPEAWGVMSGGTSGVMAPGRPQRQTYRKELPRI